ncbi:hypothetical protein JCM6882_001134 [Rhodosporidiobolus microsporus]
MPPRPTFPPSPSVSTTTRDDEEKEASSVDNVEDDASPSRLTLERKGLGVVRIEAVSAHLSMPLRVWVYVGIFFVSYCYTLDSTVRSTLQSYATSSFANHSLLATVNVLKSIIAAACYPAYAKLADTFGRVEMMVFCAVLYVIGTIVEATSTNIQTFCAGAVLYQFGYSAAILIPYIIIADLTSLRSRVVISVIPYTPWIINTFPSGNVVSAIEQHTTWNVGIGVWAAVFPVTVAFMVAPLCIAEHRARKAGTLGKGRYFARKEGWREVLVGLFWELDVVGCILIIALLALILLPFTLAGGVREAWQAPHNIAMLVVGVVVALPAFVVWEKWYARVPAVPVKLLKSRTILGCLGISILPDLCYALQGEYLYTVLVVAFNESITSATRISSISGFASSILGIATGLFVRYGIPRLKLLILCGMGIYILAFGLLIRYRGSDGDSHGGMIGAQLLIGIASGTYPFATQVLVQVEGSHAQTAVLLALYRSVGFCGSAIGQTIGGAIWTQVLPNKLANGLSNATEVASVYGSPFEWVAYHPWGTPEREAVVHAYAQVQRLLCITGICFCIPLIGCALILKDHVMTADQNLADDDSVRKGPEAQTKQPVVVPVV